MSTLNSKCRVPVTARLAGSSSTRSRRERGRIKRVIYPPGWRWTTHMQPITGGERYMHAHVGFLVQGRVMVEYADGCRDAYQAPTAVVVAPGHVGWVEGDEAAVLVQHDCGTETVETLGLPSAHRHDA